MKQRLLIVSLIVGLFASAILTYLATTGGGAGMQATYWRAGTENVTALETTKAVTFSNPMSDASYVVIATSSSVVSIGVSSKTAAGFTLNIAVGLSGTIDWIAVPIN